MEVDSLKAAVNMSVSNASYSKPAQSPAKTDGVTNEGVERPALSDIKLRIIGDTDNVSKPVNESEAPRVEEEKISNEFLDKIMKEANDKIFITNREFDYRYHEATHRVAIKVLDKTTKEVIKEIPPEKTLDAVAKMLELVGIIIDEKI